MTSCSILILLALVATCLNGLAECSNSSLTEHRLSPTVYVEYMYDMEYVRSLQAAGKEVNLPHRQLWRPVPSQKMLRMETTSINFPIEQNGYDYVYKDPRNKLRGGPISVGVHGHLYNDTTSLSVDEQNYWFMQAFLEWQNIKCNGKQFSPFTFIDIADRSLPGVMENYEKTLVFDPSLIQADVQVIGFKSSTEFPLFAENTFAAGLTANFCWEDTNGELTDIDKDNKCDIAVVSACTCSAC
jgi:hypothetical protein